MNHDTTPLIAFVMSMALSVLVIPIGRRFAERLGMIDEPGERKVHLQAIPRTGGIGIIAGTLLALFTLLNAEPVVVSFLVGALIITAFGVWDDISQIRPGVKFLGQFLAITVVIFYGDVWIRHLPFTGIDGVSPWVGIPFTYFAIIGMSNAVNTSDGLDGLAGGESMLSLIVIAFLAYIVDGIQATVIAAACIGGVLGFLRFNTHPALLFMGDAGSQFLGFTLGFLAVYLTQNVHPTLSPALTLFFLGLPVMDLVAVMIMRLMKGKSPFRADRTHIHHRLMNLGFDHYETVVIIYSVQAFFVISAIFLRYQSDALIMVLYLFSALVIFGLLSRAENIGWKASLSSPTSLTVSVRFLRTHKIDITQWALRLIMVILPLYLIGSSIIVETVPRDFGMVGTIFFIVMLLDMFYSPQSNGFSLRGGVYIAAIFTIYLAAHSERFSYFTYIEVVLFALVALSIAIVVRYATDKKFQTSPMDYLIVFAVVAIAVFGRRYLQIEDIGILVVKSIIILYGCEVLLTRYEKQINAMNIAALATMGILGYRGFVSGLI